MGKSQRLAPGIHGARSGGRLRAMSEVNRPQKWQNSYPFWDFAWRIIEEPGKALDLRAVITD